MFYLCSGEIVPEKGIGSLKLGMSSEEIRSVISDFEIEHIETSSVFICGDVRIWVDKEMDRCTQILVKNGFKGKYNNKIGLGMTLTDINKMGWEWYEDLDAYFIKEISGICFELADAEDDDDEWNELTAPIVYITVFKN